jgi:predicted RecA/RadA family phage recombinase
MELKNIYAAFVKAQTGFAPALKTSTNPHFKSKYADLAACVEAVVDSLNANGIGLVQRAHPDETGVAVETVFVHESGESFSGGIFRVPAAKQDPQGYGSALSYARRYSLMAACGIAPEDDDGNAGSKRPEARTTAGAPASQDMTPKARAARICVGVSAGDAAGAALALSEMPEALRDAIWAHIDGPTQAKLTAAWPTVDV